MGCPPSHLSMPSRSKGEDGNDFGMLKLLSVISEVERSGMVALWSIEFSVSLW